ncbi:MAG: hypothetical protein QG608_2448 [Actinomycetota bacterium]|nr:hypothetical protein [Actinomycetota bacterium]
MNSPASDRAGHPSPLQEVPGVHDGHGPPDRLTPQRLAEVSERIAGVVGLDATGAHRIKFTNNAVVALPAAAAVIRIAGSTTIRHRVPAVIAAARLFADHDIPAVRLWPGIDQPLRVGHHLATLWQHTPAGGPAPLPADLARILHAIHAIRRTPPAGIPAWRLPARIRQRLLDADGVDTDTVTYLTAELADLETALARLDDIAPLLPPGLLHGDAHLGNLIATPDGPVICDFDSTATGRREWDLIPAAVGSHRFGYTPDVHQGLAGAYGLDVMTWPGFDILRRLREFQLITSVLPVLGANPALRPQWQHRLNTYRTGDTHARWTPYATT